VTMISKRLVVFCVSASMVVSADTVNTFKHRLDKFWLNQEVIYNYKADLAGTGNWSIIN